MTFPTKNIQAKIYVNDTLKVKATLKVYKRGSYTYLPSFGQLEVTKSFTIIYAKNAASSKNQFAQNAIGKRRNGDQLVYFESRNVTNVSRFPSRAIQFAGDAYITYVGFSFNVSGTIMSCALKLKL